MTYVPSFGCYDPGTEPNLMSHNRYTRPQYENSPSAEFQYAISDHHHPTVYSTCAISSSNYTIDSGPRSMDQSLQRPGYTTEEACKVLVTSIQHKARQSEVMNWIQHQVGEYASAISCINIPLVEPKGRIKGHAFITLTNATAAEATVRILDQKLFQGRVVSTRLTTEGITDSERAGSGSKPRGAKAERQQLERRGEHSSRAKEATGAAESRRHGLTKSRASTATAIVGSSSRHSTSGKKAESGPVIAHGSSTRKADKKK